MSKILEKVNTGVFALVGGMAVVLSVLYPTNWKELRIFLAITLVLVAILVVYSL